MNAAVNILGKQALKRYGKKKPNSDNPYMETVTIEKNGRTKTKRRERPIPEGLSKNDAKILRRVRRRAYRWDQQFHCCCFSFRFGWSAILGLIPIVGDALEVLISLSIVRTASKVDGGLPKRLYSMMITFIILDFAFGFIPVLGDAVDFAFRANTRNAWLLDSYLTEKAKALREGVVKDEEEGTKVSVPAELTVSPQDRDVEEGIEPIRELEPIGSAPPAAVPPAWTPAPKVGAPPLSSRSLTGRQARDPREKN
ncbi:uncharacterized protein C8A04DRAFT_9845 [Dichotomopilus funicola]|uniref:Uncharacterized protein n=1 Tax=Dichotomopilus funicola TaxID=1934379 RepID=A0AAN6V7P0_9PEZI|nr:hypothetical protein C8A04DRAFT_9845 [Dichotomopilus funicola]